MAGDKVDAAFNASLAKGMTVEDWFVSLMGSVRAGIDSYLWPEVNLEKVETRTCEFINAVMASDCIARGDVDHYRRLANELVNDLQLLKVAPKEPDEREKWQRRAQELGWDDDLSLLLEALNEGETLADLQWDHAITSSGRELSRRALRLSRKEPYSPFSDDEYLRINYRPMRQPANV